MPIRYVILLAPVLRVAFAVFALITTGSYEAFHALDTGSYIEAARSLAGGQGFAIGGAPEIVRTPGYPMMLAIGAALGNLELVAVALQIALSVLTVYLIYRIGLLLFARTEVASLCALLYAIEPLSILYTSKVLTETLFATTLVVFLCCILRYFERRSPVYLAASGLALSASAFVRPIILYYPLLVGAILLTWGLLRTPKKTSLETDSVSVGAQHAVPLQGGFLGALRERRMLASAVAVGLFLLLSLGPTGLWQLRNATVADYNGFSAISDINWYFYQGAATQAAGRGVPYYVVQDELGYSNRDIYYEQHPEQRAWSQGAVYEYMGREGRKAVAQDLPAYLTIHASGMLKTLANPGGVEYLKTLNLYPDVGGEFGVAVNAGLGETIAYLVRENPLLLGVNVLFGLMLVAYLLLALVALISLVSTRRFSVSHLIVATLGLYLLVMSGGPQSLSRFRHPIMPVVCIFAGYGLYMLVVRARKTTN